MSAHETALTADLSAHVLDVSDQERDFKLQLSCGLYESSDTASSFSNTASDANSFETFDDCEDDVPDGYLRFDLSADTLNQLCGFFGDGVTIDGMSTTVELPYAVCHEIFKAATLKHYQLEETKNDEQIAQELQYAFECEEETIFSEAQADFLEETASDEQIALELQRQYNSAPKKEAVFSQANSKNLKRLCREFPGFPEKNVLGIFKDNNYDYVGTRETLAIMADESGPVAYQPVEPQHKVAPVRDEMNFVQRGSQWLPVDPRRKVENKGKEKVDLYSLSEAQEIAKTMLVSVQEDKERKKECQQKAAALSGKNAHWVRQYYYEEARNYGMIISNGIEKANAVICDSNLRAQESTIDLHLLNVPNALKLLKQRLAQFDRPSLRNHRSNRCLNVVTGYGKNSGGNCKLKPAVKNWLDQHNYTYAFSNRGEFQVRCK